MIDLNNKNINHKNDNIKYNILYFNKNNITEDSNSESLFYLEIYSLLLQNDIYNQDDIYHFISLLYYRSDIIRLTILLNIKPKLLTLSLEQLIKIIFYGRSDVLQFIINNMKDQLISLISIYNPYDLSLLKDTKILFTKDIWNNNSWEYIKLMIIYMV